MKVELIDGVMTVETSVNEILGRVNTISGGEYQAQLDYFCTFIGAMGLARLRRKSFPAIIDGKRGELINCCNREKAAELCIQLLKNAGASQKYLASYRRYLRELGFKVSENNVVSSSGYLEHAILDDYVGEGSTNERSFENFRNRIRENGIRKIIRENDKQHCDYVSHNHFRLGILTEINKRGHGDDKIIMSYNLK